MGAFRRRVGTVALLGGLAAAFTAPADQISAAAPNQLSNPSVSPTGGTTTTTFVFGVRYIGDHPATTVIAVVGSRSISLSLTSGSATNGTYAGSSTLPAGTWTVTFVAVATKGNSPNLSGPTITVTGPPPSPSPSPSPSPVPSPSPTAAPVVTAAPTAAPPTTKPAAPGPVATAVVTPAAAAPTSSGSAVPGGVVAPGESANEQAGGGVGNSSPGESDLVPAFFWPIMLSGFGLIGLVIAYWMLATRRDQRRQELAAEMALNASVSAHDARAAEPPRPKANWELDAALEGAPIGTVEYRPVEDGSTSRQAEDGRSLRRRS